MRNRIAMGAAGALGLAVGVLLFLPPIWPQVREGANDFQAFYAEGRVVLSGHLYDMTTLQAAEADIFKNRVAVKYAVRPPFFAVAMWPLSRLPYRVAWPLWVALLVAATAGFVWLWPDRMAAAVACCWSGGLVMCLALGQDLPIILLWLAIALRLHKSRPFWAGLVLVLCGAKYHIFLFMPLLVWRHRLWRGFVTGAAGLLAISLAAGLDWPRQYLANLADPEDTLFAVDHMPNLNGLVEAWPHALAWEILAALLVGAVVFMVVRRTGFPEGLAAVLVGGLLVSHHAYGYDCALLLPVLLTFVPVARGWGLLVMIWLLLPLSAFALLAGHPAGDLTRLGIVALLGWIAWHSREKVLFKPVGSFAYRAMQSQYPQ